MNIKWIVSAGTRTGMRSNQFEQLYPNVVFGGFVQEQRGFHS